MHLPLNSIGIVGEQTERLHERIVAVLVLCEPTHTSRSLAHAMRHVAAYRVPATSKHETRSMSLSSSMQRTDGCSPVVSELGVQSTEAVLNT